MLYRAIDDSYALLAFTALQPMLSLANWISFEKSSLNSGISFLCTAVMAWALMKASPSPILKSLQRELVFGELLLAKPIGSPSLLYT